MSTLVSIIIPSFNSERFIAETLESVSAQTYMNWECLIVDDGSEDDTIGIIQEFCNRDKRFRFYSRHRPPKSASTCRNIGLEYSKGEFVVFLDSDDLLAPWCLERRIEIINEKQNHDLWIFPTGHFIRTPGDSPFRWNIMHKDTDDLERFILHDNPWCVTGPIWKRGVINELRGFDENALCWQDWELHIRMLMKRYKYYKAGDEMVDAYYRKGRSSDSNSISSDQNGRAFLNFRIGLYKTVFEIAQARGLSGSLKLAFKVAFYRIIRQADELSDRQTSNGLITYCYRVKIMNKFEKLLLKVFTTRFNSHLLKKLISRIALLALVQYNRQIYSFQSSDTYIYSKIKEIDLLYSCLYEN